MKGTFKKIAAYTLSCMMAVTMMPFFGQYAFADDNQDPGQDPGQGTELVQRVDTGLTTTTKPTLRQVRERWAAIPDEPTGNAIYSVKNNLSTYEPSVLSDEAIEYASSLINFYRFQAGLSDITLDDTLNVNASHGALILAKNSTGNTHTPQTPEGLTEDQVKQAKYATATSNLASSYDNRAISNILSSMVCDLDSSNMSTLGHRRWLLHPTTKTMGIGVATAADSSSHYYGAIRVFNDEKSEYYDASYGKVQFAKSAERPFSVVAWPSSGYMVNTLFNSSTPWSASLYAPIHGWASASKVSVTVTRQSDGQSWTMDAEDSNGTSEHKYFNVSQTNHGLSNVVIFNPGIENLGNKPLIGTYTVQINGLDNEETNGPVVYDVTFIDPDKIDLNELNITINNVDFTGSEITSGVVEIVDEDGNALTEGTDYTLSFENNTGIGEGSVTITGKGAYSGVITRTFNIAENGHVWNDGETTEQPTCQKAGKILYTCLGCGATREEVVQPSDEYHTWKDVETVTEATCSTKGTMKIVCEVCGEESTKAIPIDENNHTGWSEGVVTTPATCVAEGVKTFTCTGCGAEKTEPVPIDSEAHRWSKGVISDYGTCSLPGKKRFVCLDCGAEKFEDIEGNPDNHTWDSGEITQQPTCTENGVKTYTCLACGAKKTQSVAATGHSFHTSASVPSTCEASGYTQRTCEKCGLVETTNINPKEHEWSTEYATDKEPTCTTAGTKSIHCKRCGIVQDGSTEFIDPLNHDYRLIDTVKASIGADGSKVYSCSRCGEEKTSIIPAVKTVSISAGTFEYNGTKRTPSVTVTDTYGKSLAGSFSCSFPGSTAVGKYKVTVTLKGDYSGSKALEYKIIPKRTSLKTLKKGKKRFKATWTKVTAQCTGYQIQYALNSSFTNKCKTKTIKSYKTAKATIKSLKKKKVYYVRIRTYKTAGGATYYSNWSAVRSVKTK